DRADLPHLEVTTADRVELADHLDQHATLVRERHRTEERRLAYVAVTRARSMLLVSGYAWDNAKEPRQPSAFLVEIRDLAEVDEWFVPPDGAVNPRLSAAREAIWPVDPLGDRRPGVPAGAVTWTYCWPSTPRCRRRRPSMSSYRRNCPCRNSLRSAATRTSWLGGCAGRCRPSRPRSR